MLRPNRQDDTAESPDRPASSQSKLNQRSQFTSAARRPLPEVENLADNESDELNHHKQLTASPQILAWKEKGSFHHQMIERKRSQENVRRKKELQAKFESKILGLADI